MANTSAGGRSSVKGLYFRLRQLRDSSHVDRFANSGRNSKRGGTAEWSMAVVLKTTALWGPPSGLSVPAVGADSVFSKMHKAGVSFYDASKNVPQFPAAGRGIPGGTLEDFYA